MSFGVIFRLSLVVTALVVLMQNCAPHLEQTYYAPEMVAFTEEEIEEAPFAFETQIDHMAYLSCHDLTIERNNRRYATNVSDISTYFTFRVGALNSGGVRFAPGFVSYVDGLISNRTAVVDRGDAMASMASVSPTNRGAQVQLAVRNRQSMRTTIRLGNTQGSGVSGADYSYVLRPLTERFVLDRMISDVTGWHRYFSGGQNFQPERTVTGSLRFVSANEDDLISSLANSHYLVTSYTLDRYDSQQNQLPWYARHEGPIGQYGDSIYGKAYRPDFIRAGSHYSHPRRLMTGVREYKLNEGLTDSQSQWVCDSRYRLQIVDPDPPDGAPECPAMTASERASFSDVIDRIEFFLRPADWVVNLVRRCARPQNGNCYTGLDNVEYNTSNACGYRDGPDNDDDPQTDPPQEYYECPHYFSMCYRS